MPTSCVFSRDVVTRPLAACLLLALGTGAAASPHPMSVERAPRGAIPVTNCDDDGDGSLRAVVAAATSGDTIDLGSLTCSTITLTTGFIGIEQDDLSLIGSGSANLSIDAGDASGVIRHTGAGTLAITGLTLSHGHYQSAQTPRGGCIYSAANLDIAASVVTDCAAVGTASEIARGGAVYAHGNLSLAASLVTASHAQGTASGAHGGGVYVRGDFTAHFSTISNNAAYGAPINGGQGGGAMIVGTTTLNSSTVSGNGAYSVGGIWTQDEVTIDSSTISDNGASLTAGMRATYTSGSPIATIVNSTIANNHAVARVGGLNLIIPAKISNTTIAFNEAFNGLAGVLMSGPTLELESTIISGNDASGEPDDLDGYGSPVITGANNLVIASSAPLPPDTISSDPLLGTLGDNGGPTPTIPLTAGSPAIDTGNNLAQLATDQRGPGFARDVGLAADIGAFEVQTSDIIFANGFDPGD